MSANSYDWSRFTVRINVNAAGKILYDAWATRAGMEYWFLRLSEYKKPDGSLRGNKDQVEKGDGGIGEKSIARNCGLFRK